MLRQLSRNSTGILDEPRGLRFSEVSLLLAASSALVSLGQIGIRTRLSIPSCGGCCIPESGWFAHESKKDAAAAPRHCRDLTNLGSGGTRLPERLLRKKQPGGGTGYRCPGCSIKGAGTGPGHGPADKLGVGYAAATTFTRAIRRVSTPNGAPDQPGGVISIGPPKGSRHAGGQRLSLRRRRDNAD